MAEVSKRLASSIIGTAGVYYTAAQLSLRDLIVLPTFRNAAGIDLLVSDPRTEALAAVQVKTTMCGRDWWPTGSLAKRPPGLRTFYVFLRYDSKAKTFEAFLESARRVAKQVKANIEDHELRIKQGKRRTVFPWWGASETELERLHKAWLDWRP